MPGRPATSVLLLASCVQLEERCVQFSENDGVLGACSTSVTGWPGIAEPPGSAHLNTFIYLFTFCMEYIPC